SCPLLIIRYPLYYISSTPFQCVSANPITSHLNRSSFLLIRSKDPGSLSVFTFQHPTVTCFFGDSNTTFRASLLADVSSTTFLLLRFKKAASSTVTLPLNSCDATSATWGENFSGAFTRVLWVFWFMFWLHCQIREAGDQPSLQCQYRLFVFSFCKVSTSEKGDDGTISDVCRLTCCPGGRHGRTEALPLYIYIYIYKYIYI